MSGALVVLGSGPSSIRFALYDAGGVKVRVRGELEAIHTAPRFVARDAAGPVLAEKTWNSGTPLGHDGATDHVLQYLCGVAGATALAAVGHRVTHGGLLYEAPVAVDAGVLSKLEGLVHLAPLHQPSNLAPIRRLLDRAPQLTQVTCFETAFHRTQPEIAQMYALPRRYHDEGVRRFGFHGLSYENVATRLAALDPAAARGRAIALHLGNGASMCALREGRSIATSMGFSALDGVPTGTRCGALDPGVVLYLMERHRLDARGVEKLLYQQSGLLGVSGISSDMRTLLASAERGARTAIDLYLYRIRRELGSLAAVLGGVDALVFTGGVGENAAAIRAGVCRDAAWLGVEVDEGANAAHAPLITTAASRVKAWIVAGDEEGVIARHAQRLVHRAAAAERAHA